MKIYKIISTFAQDNKNPLTKIYLNKCNLHCYYCTNRMAIDELHDMDIQEVIEEIQKLQNTDIYITGGEPSLQSEDISSLTKILTNMKYRIFIETNGTFPAKDLPTDVTRIIHCKTPGSGMSGVNNYENFRMAKSGRDIFRFVITSQSDYDWAKKTIKKNKLNIKYKCIISPCKSILNQQWLIEIIKTALEGTTFLNREELPLL